MIEDHDAGPTSSPSPASPAHHPVLATVLACCARWRWSAGIVLGGVARRQVPTTSPPRSRTRWRCGEAAQRFTETWNTFSAEDPQGYIDQVAPLLSTKFRAEFTEAATDVVVRHRAAAS